jgi:hypothetical protein
MDDGNNDANAARGRGEDAELTRDDRVPGADTQLHRGACTIYPRTPCLFFRSAGQVIGTHTTTRIGGGTTMP